MGRPKKEREPLPTIWEAPDELWAMIAPILAEHDPPKRGPKRIEVGPGVGREEGGDRGLRQRVRAVDRAAVHVVVPRRGRPLPLAITPP